jgi:SAM-dependent methyltransferase
MTHTQIQRENCAGESSLALFHRTQEQLMNVNRNTQTPWYADETFWRELFPFMFSDASFASARAQTAALMKLALPMGSKVLDLCCGPGRFAIPLAEAGMQVTAVDGSEYLLSQGSARPGGSLIEWVHADMREYVSAEPFDAIVCMGTSFGYFENPEDDALALKRMLGNLRPGGICVIDLRGKELVARAGESANVSRLPDGTTLVHRHQVIDNWTRTRNEWILINSDQAKTYVGYANIYSGSELRDLLLAAGFERVALQGDLVGSPYDARAERLTAVAHRALT